MLNLDKLVEICQKEIQDKESYEDAQRIATDLLDFVHKEHGHIKLGSVILGIYICLGSIIMSADIIAKTRADLKKEGRN